MIPDICPKRTRRLTEQARQGVVHSFCLAESESSVDNGLYEHLSKRQSTATQM